MQDRYTGDLGDFGKYGLLRALCAPEDTSPALSLGVVWYLYPHQESNADGKHVAYLDSSVANQRAFRDCDPVLYDGLKTIVVSGRRCISRIREQGILPASTRFFEEELTLNDLPSVGSAAKAARELRQNGWMERAQDSVIGCDVVFVDPDNGLEVTSATRLSNRGPKYVFFDDLKPYVQRNQSLVIYRHFSHRGKISAQVDTALARLKEHLDCPNPLALVYHRGTARAFLVVPAARHQHIIRERTDRFLSGGWTQHFDRSPKV